MKTRIEAFRKRRAIKSYVRRLPGLLARDYGKRGAYTPTQIERTIERHGLKAAYACYGIAMFSDRLSFDQHHQEAGEHCDYDSMRREIADEHFGGDPGFDTGDIESVSASYGGHPEEVGSASEGAGDGGSD
ncbi:DUF6559 family protein [Arhodomonas sp. AD133]|uniref:DUF6559 family protein n=1 Tax=Arhodomonas sp. AD133 TaxID=3415009 RepID=UPI003EC03268